MRGREYTRNGQRVKKKISSDAETFSPMAETLRTTA
jgi:hypothetical protein